MTCQVSFPLSPFLFPFFSPSYFLASPSLPSSSLPSLPSPSLPPFSLFFLSSSSTLPLFSPSLFSSSPPLLHLTPQSFLVSMMNLGDSDSDLYQLLKQIDYQPSDFHSGRLKHISLPQCTNKDARASFETALHGVFSEFYPLVGGGRGGGRAR